VTVAHPSLSSAAAPALVRRLGPADATAYHALRVRGLAEYPLAFTSSAEEEAARPLDWSVQRLSDAHQRPNDLFLGAFLAGQLQGLVGLQGRYRPKERHNATVVGLFVAPEAGGRGLGRALMTELLNCARARPELLQLDLTVTEGNATAQALYASLGFTVYGVLPNAVRVEGRDYAKIHMVCRLR
jgi:ribosomal protein S18 acetylase RimI-like enzyme